MCAATSLQNPLLITSKLQEALMMDGDEAASDVPATDTESDQPEAKQEKSFFLNFPPELRNMLYTYSFRHNHTCNIDTIDEGHPLQYLQLPPLAFVCRGMRSEIIPFFFETAKFTIWIGCDARERQMIVGLRTRTDLDTDPAFKDILTELESLSLACGRPGICSRTADLLSRLQQEGGISIRNITINIIQAKSIKSLQTWLPQRIHWMHQNKRFSPAPETMWETTLRYEAGVLHIESTTRKFPGAKNRDFASLRAEAERCDGKLSRPARTYVFDAPDEDVARIMRTVEVKAQRRVAREGFRGFTLMDLEALVRKYRVAAKVKRVRAFGSFDDHRRLEVLLPPRLRVAVLGELVVPTAAKRDLFYAGTKGVRVRMPFGKRSMRSRTKRVKILDVVTQLDRLLLNGREGAEAFLDVPWPPW